MHKGLIDFLNKIDNYPNSLLGEEKWIWDIILFGVLIFVISRVWQQVKKWRNKNIKKP